LFTAEDYFANDPRELKRDTVLSLLSAKSEDARVNEKIDRAVGYVEASLSDKWWTDDYHIVPGEGKNVFLNEAWVKHADDLLGYGG
jgi:hypothetical protein